MNDPANQVLQGRGVVGVGRNKHSAVPADHEESRKMPELRCACSGLPLLRILNGIGLLAHRCMALVDKLPVAPGEQPRRHILPWVVTAALLLMVTSTVAAQTISPEEEQKTFQLADGFRANLFAAEDLGVLNPLSMRWDAQGRLFVISTLAYPQLRPGEISNDKIIMLEDSDDDGRADKSTVFADGLNIPTGLEVGNGGVYVGEQTKLLFLKDTDGDGRADHREVVLSGFGTGDTHQAINSFVWSPGGELFFDQGDGIESRVETPWGVSSLFQAGVFRFRPQRLQLDPLLDDFMGPGNPWGIAFDDWGQAFVVDGAGGISFLSPAMLPVKHVQRLRTIGKPGGYCGVEILGSRHLPEDFQGNFLVGDFHRNRIGRFETKPVGAGFEVAWKPPLLVSSHRNFRPVDVRTGPDGAIYICDWYNSVICHQDDPFRRPDRDLTHGRIWRIAHESSDPIQKLDLQSAPLVDLFQHLSSPERWVRYQAKRVLANRNRSDVSQTLRAWWESRSASERTDQLLFELIGVLESVEAPDRDLLEQLLGSRDHRGRAYATRVVGRWHDRLADPLELLEPRIRDPHPAVRMEAIVACAHVPDARAVEVAAIATDHPLDWDTDYALTQAIHHLKEHWIPAFQRGELTFDDDSVRMSEVLHRVNSPELTSTLRQLNVSNQEDGQFDLGLLKTLARVGDPADLSLVLAQAVSRPAATNELLVELEYAFRTNSVKPSSDCRAALLALMSSDDSDTQSQAIELAGLWHTPGVLNGILETAEDHRQPLQVRKAALQALGKLGGKRSQVALEKTVRDDDFEVQLTAVAALCSVDLPAAAKLGTGLVISSRHFRETHYATLLRAFLSRRDGPELLRKELANASPSPELARSLLQALGAAGQSHEGLIALLNQAAGLSSTVPEFSEDFVATLAQDVENGDPYRGETVFRSKLANCYACHQIGGVGGIVGPDLSSVGTTLPLDRLIQEVLWPGRQIKEGYSLRQIITNDGEVHQGYVRKGRDKRTVYLRLLHANELLRIPKEAIEDEGDAGSAMPTNVVGVLSETDRIDLLCFLSRLGTLGDFSVADQDIVRAWHVFRGSLERPLGQALIDKNLASESAWTPAISRVSGALRLDELEIPAADQALLKSTFTTQAARRRLELDSGLGLQIWIDGKPVTVDENIELEFEAGTHELMILVDLNERPSNELRVEWQHID